MTHTSIGTRFPAYYVGREPGTSSGGTTGTNGNQSGTGNQLWGDDDDERTRTGRRQVLTGDPLPSWWMGGSHHE